MAESTDEQDDMATNQEMIFDVEEDEKLPTTAATISQQSPSTDHNDLPEREALSIFQGFGKDELDEIAKHYIKKNQFAVMVPPIARPWEYREYREPSVLRVIQKYEDDGNMSYLVRMTDGAEELVSSV